MGSRSYTINSGCEAARCLMEKKLLVKRSFHCHLCWDPYGITLRNVVSSLKKVSVVTCLFASPSKQRKPETFFRIINCMTPIIISYNCPFLTVVSQAREQAIASKF